MKRGPVRVSPVSVDEGLAPPPLRFPLTDIPSGTVRPTTAYGTPNTGCSAMEDRRSRPFLELLEGARGGGEEALEILLDRLRPRVKRYLVGRLQSHPSTDALAAEMTQDVLVRVAESIEDCRATTERQLNSWIRTIARRRVIDRYRKRERELDKRVWQEDQRVDGRLLIDGLIDEDTELSSEDVSELDEILGALLWKAQAELSAGTRQTLRRRLLYGETWPQVGEVVGTSGAGAKRRYQRAQDRLRREVLARIRELPSDLQAPLLERLGVPDET